MAVVVFCTSRKFNLQSGMTIQTWEHGDHEASFVPPE